MCMEEKLLRVVPKQLTVSIPQVDSTHVHFCITAVDAIELQAEDYLLFSIEKSKLINTLLGRT